ncbi:MAG: flagellar protein FlaG [Candidatus Neomarinimicrobiota bacterium]|nr:MAG: flagellar protein FlaG [Candidatus Neomarinimicrobiota bacterium]
MDGIQEIQRVPTAAIQAESPPQVHFPTGKGSDPDSGKARGSEKKEQPAVDVNKMIKAYNSFVKKVGTKLSFTKDEASGRVVILVRDQETGEVIRQIPSKEMLELLAKMKNLEGMLFDQKG